jgi:hypothetical protein
MSIAPKIAAETYTDRAEARYTKPQWLNAVKWCLDRGMCEGDVRNHMQMHADAA